MQYQNRNKKAVFLVIVGVILTAFGIVLRKNPEAVDAFKAKVAKRFGGSEN